MLNQNRIKDFDPLFQLDGCSKCGGGPWDLGLSSRKCRFWVDGHPRSAQQYWVDTLDHACLHGRSLEDNLF